MHTARVQTRRLFFGDVSIRNSLRSNKRTRTYYLFDFHNTRVIKVSNAYEHNSAVQQQYSRNSLIVLEGPKQTSSPGLEARVSAAQVS